MTTAAVPKHVPLRVKQVSTTGIELVHESFHEDTSQAFLAWLEFSKTFVLPMRLVVSIGPFEYKGCQARREKDERVVP